MKVSGDGGSESFEKYIEEKSIPLIEGQLIKVRVKELVKRTGMLVEDIVETSSRLGYINGRYGR